MTSTTTALPSPGEFGRRSPARLLRILQLEIYCEFLKLLRMPAYIVPTFAFPLLFYVLFGLAFNQGTVGGTGMPTYLLVSYGTFGVIGANLFSLGFGLATERAQGWMLFKRATPMPPLAHFVARVTVGMALSLLIVTMLFVFGALFGGVVLPRDTWVLLALWLVVGGVPFAAFGMGLGYLCGPNSAPAVINLIYLPVSFASGLWIPHRFLPPFFQDLAPWLPPFHVAQQGYRLLGVAEAGVSWPYTLSVLAVFTAASLAVGVWAYHRDQDTFG